MTGFRHPFDRDPEQDRLVAEALANPGKAPCMVCGAIGVKPGTRLCQECRDRPYGTVGERVPDTSPRGGCRGVRHGHPMDRIPRRRQFLPGRYGHPRSRATVRREVEADRERRAAELAAYFGLAESP
jgi:hypothetical protein